MLSEEFEEFKEFEEKELGTVLIGVSANGRFGLAGTTSGRGEKLGAPMVLLLPALFRAGFEPLS
jgi:hypothetical protein